MSEVCIDSDFVCDLLNEAFDCDPAAMHTLVLNRVPCRAALADHPDIIVSQIESGRTSWTIGLLGIINGILSRAGQAPVAIQFDDEQQGKFAIRKIDKFSVVRGEGER